MFRDSPISKIWGSRQPDHRVILRTRARSSRHQPQRLKPNRSNPTLGMYFKRLEQSWQYRYELFPMSQEKGAPNEWFSFSSWNIVIFRVDWCCISGMFFTATAKQRLILHSWSSYSIVWDAWCIDDYSWDDGLKILAMRQSPWGWFGLNRMFSNVLLLH